MLPQLVKLKEVALDFLFPQSCIACGQTGSFICASCRETLIPLAPPLCPLCGRPNSDTALCPDCRGWQAQIDGIRSPFRYDGVMRRAVHELKYRNLRALAPLLAAWLHGYLKANPLPAEVLVPVPLHPRRLRERGYNQSALLAKELGKLMNMPVVEDCLVRRRHTLPQARTANVEERRRNISNAFTCQNGKLKERKVLLIDDVATSGTTLDACAGAMKSAGATSVWGLVPAREI